MFGRNLLLSCLFLVPTASFASDGVIRFSGSVVEPTCVIQTDKNEIPALNSCSKHVASSTSVRTQIVAPTSHMVPWRANDTSKPDAPVTQWKVTQVVYL
ncbi:type 1 fimbria pilin [Oxalobacteraceae bacterium GrIS 2.11]